MLIAHENGVGSDEPRFAEEYIHPKLAKTLSAIVWADPGAQPAESRHGRRKIDNNFPADLYPKR